MPKQKIIRPRGQRYMIKPQPKVTTHLQDLVKKFTLPVTENPSDAHWFIADFEEEWNHNLLEEGEDVPIEEPRVSGGDLGFKGHVNY